MDRVPFFTPVCFGSQPKTFTEELLEQVDDYFYFGGKKACVISGSTDEGGKITVLRDSPSFQATALRIASLATVIIPLVMVLAKIVLRLLHIFYIIDIQKDLEKGIDPSQETIARIQALMPKILACEEDPEITWFATGNNLVFSVHTDPKIVFKLAPHDQIRCGLVLTSTELVEDRFANMIKAKEICLARNLDLLTVPHAKMIEVESVGRKVAMIAEERFEFKDGEGMQDELYRTLPGLDRTKEQLAILTAESDWSDVMPRNAPILDDQKDFPGDRRVVLIDVEDMDSAAEGIFGGGCNGSGGLMKCLFTEQQIDTALAIARTYNLSPRYTTPEKVKAERMKEIETEERLQKFYAAHGIDKDARQPIHIDDLGSLGLDLDAEDVLHLYHGTGSAKTTEEKKFTLREVLTAVIEYINEAIQKASEKRSTESKRCVRLNANYGDFVHYECLGAKDEPGKKRWLPRIIEELVEKGYLFRLIKNGNGYCIQA